MRKVWILLIVHSIRGRQLLALGTEAFFTVQHCLSLQGKFSVHQVVAVSRRKFVRNKIHEGGESGKISTFVPSEGLHRSSADLFTHTFDARILYTENMSTLTQIIWELQIRKTCTEETNIKKP